VNPPFQEKLKIKRSNLLWRQEMENRKKILLAIPLLILGALVIISAHIQNIAVGYPVGLALGLLGSIFWLLAE